MENNEPNKIVSRIYKKFIQLREGNNSGNNDNYYTEIEKLNKELRNITVVVGAIEVMSKKNILRICSMESSLRFMALHTFLIYVSKAAK